MIPFKPCYLPLAIKGIVFAMYSLVPVTALQAQALEEIQQLPNVVVSTTASTRELERAMASVSVVDGVVVRRRPHNDLFDMIHDQVGIASEYVGAGGGRGISIRGMDSEHSLILIDGQRINHTAGSIAHSNLEQTWVPAEAIERIEIVRGPMSSLYGSESLGGVVNVVTRAATEQWQASFNQLFRLGSKRLKGDLYKSGFYAGGPLIENTLGINLWGELRRRQALLNAQDRRLSTLDEQQAKSLHVGLTWTPDTNQRIDLGVDINREELAGVRLASAGRTKANTPYEIDSLIRRHRYSLAYRGDWAWGSLQLRWYQSRLKRDVERCDTKEVSAPNRFVDTVWDAQTQIDVGVYQRLSLGVEWRREQVEDPNINAEQKDKQSHFAVYLQDEISLGEQWEAVIGGRFDKHQRFGWQFSPRSYLLFKPTDNWTFRAGVGKGFKAPTLKQLSPSYESRAAMGGRGIVRGNPDLAAETNTSYELGAAYRADDWSVAATLFQNHVKNLITTVRLPKCNERGFVCLNYQNINQTRLQGVELSAQWDVSTDWAVSANYTYLSARDRLKNEPLLDRSRHRANVALTWSPLAQLETTLRYEYVGSQLGSGAVANQSIKRPSYALIHWDISYELNKSLRLYGGVENISNKRLANEQPELYQAADEGRRFYAGFNLAY